jgi:predicted nuclease of predicted toxin-antitoxin system
MRILLDECLPARFRRELPGHEVQTVPQAGWASIKNGKLLQLIAASEKFDLFLTVDKKLPEQNKISALPFAIVVLRAYANSITAIRPFAPEILRRLSEFQRGQVYFLTSPVS